MRVGSLFSGYGGLDMAVGGELAWYAEVEPAARRVMEAHHPGVPNLGDVTQVDWAAVEPVDVITGGYPCQPFSNAGMRRGKDDERHLWPYVRDALGAIRPRAAVLENVRGHLTLGFADVLADLADLGMSARWGVVRASDAGAPHSRARLFIFADSDSKGLQGNRHSNPPGRNVFGSHGEQQLSSDPRGRQLAGPAQWWGLSEPAECRPSATADASGERHGRRQGPGRLAAMGCAPEGIRRTAGTPWQEPGAGSAIAWGEYGPAIERWAAVLGRPAPAPTVRRAERDRLNPVFVEWMMGLPEGWVTGHGLSASAELKMLGNGVVPQQAALALRLLGAA